jgi:hypothetical protein
VIYQSREELVEIEAFLDDMAVFFDEEKPVSPDTLFTDPVSGQAITARAMLLRIRLHESVARLQ